MPDPNALLGILGPRFVQSRRNEERMTAELEAAKAVQHVLIPAETPDVPGLAIETAYKPAGEDRRRFLPGCAPYTEGPAGILGAMNQRMLAQSKGGFTTCLVLRPDPDGTLVLANAGHLSPYLGGKELEIENGLRLGSPQTPDTPSRPIHSRLILN